MPCTAISEGPCSAGRKANPSRHQPGILCHPCQQGCRETEHPQARSHLPPRTGSKAASAAGSAGGAMGQGEWGQQSRQGQQRLPDRSQRSGSLVYWAMERAGVHAMRESYHKKSRRKAAAMAPDVLPLFSALCPRIHAKGPPPTGTVSAWRTALRQRGKHRIPDPAASCASGRYADFFELPVRRPAPGWTIPPRQDFSPRRGSDTARSMAFCAHPVYKEKTL